MCVQLKKEVNLKLQINHGKLPTSAEQQSLKELEGKNISVYGEDGRAFVRYSLICGYYTDKLKDSGTSDKNEVIRWKKAYATAQNKLDELKPVLSDKGGVKTRKDAVDVLLKRYKFVQRSKTYKIVAKQNFKSLSKMENMGVVLCKHYAPKLLNSVKTIANVPQFECNVDSRAVQYLASNDIVLRQSIDVVATGSMLFPDISVALEYTRTGVCYFRSYVLFKDNVLLDNKTTQCTYVAIVENEKIGVGERIDKTVFNNLVTRTLMKVKGMLPELSSLQKLK